MNKIKQVIKFAAYLVILLAVSLVTVACIGAIGAVITGSYNATLSWLFI